MPINQNEIVDLLYKKIAFNVAKTNTELSRSPSEEPIASPVSTFGNHIWVAASSIPSAPPPSDTDIVKRYQSGDSDHIRLVKNPDVSNNRSWLAESNSLSIFNWIPPIFGSQYGIKVWIGDPEADPAGAYRIYPKGSGNDDQFYFDYNAGTLHFIGDNLPSGIGSGSEIYIEGYTYVGPTDVGALNATTLNDLADVTVDDQTRIQGHVLQWSEADQEWVNGPVPSGSLDDFLLTPPIQHGQVLAYVTTETDANGNPISVDKFKNQYLPYYMLDGVSNPAGNAGKYLRVANDLTLEYHTLTDLYTDGWLIDVAGSQLEHQEALAPTVLSTSNPGAAGAVQITNANNPLQSIPTGTQGPAYLTDSDLWVMMTTEVDKAGHVLGRAWRNLNGIFNQYTLTDTHNQRWAEHMAGNDTKHNIWTQLSGVSSSVQTASSRNKLLVKDDSSELNTLDHPNIVISNSKISEVHTTHVGGKTVPDFLDAGYQDPSDLDVLAYSATQDAWVFSNIANGQGQANTGRSDSENDANAFDIYKGMDIEILTFKGLKVYDANNTNIVDWSHTWDNGVDPDAEYPFLIRENPDTNTIDLKFDASKIKIYELADRLSPGNIGYSLQQLEDWSSTNQLVNPPNHGNGALTISGRAYAEGWFSNPVDSNTPNQMTQLEWAALMGGGLAATNSPGRRLRTSHRVNYSPNDPGHPTSIQQQIDDKLQYNFFVQHFTLGGRADEIRDIHFGGYYDQTGNYGFPTKVETTEGLENPIYEGKGWAHEAQSVIFKAGHLNHAGEGSWGDTYNNNWGNNPTPEWANHGVSKWNWGGGDETYHTVKSVISRHVLTHEGNPHGVTHLEVGSQTAQWNANKIQGTDVSLGTLENNHILVWDGSQWINSAILTQTGESNAAENIGAAGAGTFSGKVGSSLQFRKLKSITPKLSIAENGSVIDFDFDETEIDITNLNNFPIDINQLGNVSGAPANGDVLTYNGSGWVPAVPPGATDFKYDSTGIDEGYHLRAEEVLDPQTGLSYNPKQWKWVTFDGTYSTANKLAGLPHSVSNLILTGDISIDYEDIDSGYIMAWNGSAWIAVENPAIQGSGEINRIGSWSDADLGNDQTSNGVSLAAEVITLANGTTVDVSKRLMTDGTTRLMTKTVVSSPYIQVDTNISNAKEIAFTIDETQLSLENMGGSLDPARIGTGVVGLDEFNKLDGYAGVPIGARFGVVETDITDLQALKLDKTEFETHTDYDANLRGGGYTVGYDPAVTPGNPNGQTVVADMGGLKHQPYEIGNNLPVFNANTILNAPIDPTFAIADGSATGISTLTMDQGGKFLQWDGTQWTIGGGGEVSDGTHQQFAFYYSHSPNVSTDTQTLKPTGDAFVFIQGNGAEIESKVGMYTTDPPELFSISGRTPAMALKQITDAGNEPEVHGGWGKFYARSSAGGISAESVAVLHFDGAGGANAFLNDGNGMLFFLPQHDPDGNGVYDTTNNVVTSTDRYIYGGSSGYFPGGTGNYLAAPVPSGEIELLNKPFSIDFWFMPVLEDGETELQGKQYLFGQYQQSETFWYAAIDYDGVKHAIEFAWKEWDGANTATLHTRRIERNPLGNENFAPDTWYHLVLQRFPSTDPNDPTLGTERWDLLVAEAVGHGFTGVPSVTNGDYGLPHLPNENEKIMMYIPELNGDFLVGNFCRQENQGYNGFRGYIDEFRFQIGTYIDYNGLAYQGSYRTYLLPYDTGNSSLIYKDDLGTHDLLNSAGIVRRLKDQDGDTTIDVDTNDVNDNHVRIQTSAVEVANFSQSGFQLSNTDVRVSTIKNDLNNAYASALVTQKAVKEALDSISTKSIQDTVGTTYVHTEATTNDYKIRMVVQSSEKMSIEPTGINLKSPLLLGGVGPIEGQSLVCDANGDLTWGEITTQGIEAGTTGMITMYTAAGEELGPAPGLSWNHDSNDELANALSVKGAQKFNYLNLAEDAFESDKASIALKNDLDGNDDDTTTLYNLDNFDAVNKEFPSTSHGATPNPIPQYDSIFASGITQNGPAIGQGPWGQDCYRTYPADSNGNINGTLNNNLWAISNLGNNRPFKQQYGLINMFGGVWNSSNNDVPYTLDFWVKPLTGYSWADEAVNNYGNHSPNTGNGPNEASIFTTTSTGGWFFFEIGVDQSHSTSFEEETDLYIKVKNEVEAPLKFTTKIKGWKWNHIAIMNTEVNDYVGSDSRWWRDSVYVVFVNGRPAMSFRPQRGNGSYGISAQDLPHTYSGMEQFTTGMSNEFIGLLSEIRFSATARYDESDWFLPRTKRYGYYNSKLELTNTKNDLNCNLVESARNTSKVQRLKEAVDSNYQALQGGNEGDITYYGSESIEPATGLTWDSTNKKLSTTSLEAKDLDLESLSVKEDADVQPGLLLRTYDTCTWDPNLPHSDTNPTWSNETIPSTLVWNIIRSGNHSPAVGPDARIGTNCRWTGYWICPETRTYNFTINAQNTGWLRIDGVMMVHDNYGFDAIGVDVDGVAGKIYAIDVQKMNDGWPHDFWFQWKHSGMTHYSDDLTGMFVTEYPKLVTIESNRESPGDFTVPKVGIGTNSPTENLEVMGTIKGSRILGNFEGTFSTGVYSSIQNSIVGTNPTGAVIAYAGSSAPTGWLLCGGQTVSRTTYANLYGVVGDTYGAGDGSTTFGIPNYNSEVSGFPGPQTYIIKT